MSTESHHRELGTGLEPRHEDVSFERRDIKVGSIYGYLIVLGMTTVVALIICIFIFRFTTNFVASSEVPPPVSREALGEASAPLPPEPRLQGVTGHPTDPQQDLRDKLKLDMEANETLGWIDKQAGIAQIPVHVAMKMIAQKGLPTAGALAAEKK